MQFADPQTLTKAELESGAVFAPRFDANGLITAITVDAHSNDVLMLAHMNAEALAATLETGYAHYWSRSRQQLWKKGASSGELQELVQMRVDCDQDAVILLVNQTGHGAACHTGRKSCFFRTVEATGDSARLTDTDTPKLFAPEDVYKR